MSDFSLLHSHGDLIPMIACQVYLFMEWCYVAVTVIGTKCPKRIIMFDLLTELQFYFPEEYQFCSVNHGIWDETKNWFGSRCWRIKIRNKLKYHNTFGIHNSTLIKCATLPLH